MTRYGTKRSGVYGRFDEETQPAAANSAG
jgi:hypothetical protein